MAETKLKENIDICDICKKEVKADTMRLAGLPYRMRDSTDYKVFHMYKKQKQYGSFVLCKDCFEELDNVIWNNFARIYSEDWQPIVIEKVIKEKE